MAPSDPLPTDIWQSAQLMVKRYGHMAPVECAMKADELHASGNRDGEAVWLAIREVAQSMLESGPPADIPGLPSG